MNLVFGKCWKPRLNREVVFYFILVIVVFAGSQLSAQQAKKLAVFAPKSTFALTLIEKQLYLLEKDTLGNIFKKNEIVNINDLLAAHKDQRASIVALEQLVMNDITNIDTSSMEQADYIKELGNRIRQSAQFLQINTYTFGTFIEFQFLLYDSMKEGTHMLNTEEKKITSRIFKNNNSANELKRIINNALKELFTQEHTVPRAKINVDNNRLNGKIFSNCDSIYAAIGDTIFLDAFYSIDNDTPKEFLKYRWHKIISPGMPPNLDIELIDNGLNCQVIPNISGTYEIELFVLDGVERTNHKKHIKLAKDTLILIAKPKPNFFITPKELNSFYVQSMTKDYFFVKTKKDVILYSNESSTQVTPNLTEFITNFENIDSTVNKKHHNYDTGFSIELIYPNKSRKLNIPIRASFTSSGIFSEDLLKVNHKLYFPYYLGIFKSQNSIKLDTSINLPSGSHIWNETKVFAFFKIVPRLDVGLGWAFNKNSWETGSGELYSLTSTGEIDVSWTIVREQKANLRVNAYGKMFQVEGPMSTYTQLIGGLYGQFNATLFQGLSELSFNIAIWETPFNKDFIRDYTHWWGVGLKFYIPNRN